MFCLQIHARADCTMNEKFSVLNETKPSAVLKISSSLNSQGSSACICKQNTNLKSLTHLIYNLSSLLACKYCTPFVNKENKIKLN